MSESDIELLARYRRELSEEAFSEIVRRHLALVHSAALRQVRLPQLAEEIAQTTFLELARQADRLQPTTQLAAWLYETTRRNAVDVLRRESRRDARERTAMELNSLNAGPSEWSQLEPVLDDAMAELPSTDRTAILLRYFENRSLRDVGVALGVSDDAAQKRVSRAVDELRSLLVKRGVTVGAGALVAVISGNAVQVAPAALALTVAACSAKVAVSTAVPSIAMNAFTKSLLVTSAISLAVGVYQGVQANRLKEEVRQFSGQTTELVAKTEELTRERDEAKRRAAAVNEDLVRANMKLGDLAVLREEVDRLRRPAESQSAQPAAQANKSSRSTAHPPGTYITRDQLSYVGYATPEAAMETFAWAIMNGSFDQANEGVSPDLLTAEPTDSKAQEDFEARQAKMAPLFKGIQIAAKKLLADDRVELKVKRDFDPAMNKLETRKTPLFTIQPMVKVGAEWKIGGNTRDHNATWEKDGQIQTFVP